MGVKQASGSFQPSYAHTLLTTTEQGWDKIRDCGEPVSLARLGYQCLLQHQRRYRLAIDLGLWLKHAEWGQGAAEPELRTIYYRILKLLDAGIAPILVLDGPHRPHMKRGSYISGRNHRLHHKILELADALGIEARQAPGEAEAEAALLARQGIVDSVMSDDVDCLMFGCPVSLRNWSTNTSGAKAEAMEGRKDTHVIRYEMSQIVEDVPELNADGLAFFALLSGGDYSEGLPGCGSETALGLIRAGLHLPLLDALRTKRGSELDMALVLWRAQVCQELATNSSGLLKTKKPALARSFPHSFPDIAVARAYLQPITSASTTDVRFQSDLTRHSFDGRINIPRVVKLMTERFDYNHALIMNKITRGLRRPLMVRQFADMIENGSTDIDWHSYLIDIPKGSVYHRLHKSTDSTPEYRLVLDLQTKWPYVDEAERTLVHPDPNIGKADMWRLRDNGPDAVLRGDFEEAKTAEESRIWIAAELMQRSAKGRELIARWTDMQSSPTRKTAPAQTSPTKSTLKGKASAPGLVRKTIVETLSSAPVRNATQTISGKVPAPSPSHLIADNSDDGEEVRPDVDPLRTPKMDGGPTVIQIDSDVTHPSDPLVLETSPTQKGECRSTIIDLTDESDDEPGESTIPGSPKRKRTPARALFAATTVAAPMPGLSPSSSIGTGYQSTLVFPSVASKSKSQAKRMPEQHKKKTVVIDISP